MLRRFLRLAAALRNARGRVAVTTLSIAGIGVLTACTTPTVAAERSADQPLPAFSAVLPVGEYLTVSGEFRFDPGPVGTNLFRLKLVKEQRDAYGSGGLMVFFLSGSSERQNEVFAVAAAQCLNKDVEILGLPGFDPTLDLPVIQIVERIWVLDEQGNRELCFELSDFLRDTLAKSPAT